MPIAKCAHCDKVIHDNEYLKCVKCSKSYYFVCAGFDETTFRKLRASRRSSWECQTCKGSQHTPERQPGTDSQHLVHVGRSVPAQPQNMRDPVATDVFMRHIDVRLDAMAAQLTARLDAKIDDLGKQVTARVDASMQRFTTQLEEMTRSVQFVSDRLDAFERDYGGVPAAVQRLQRELDEERTERRRECDTLRRRLDSADQQARSTNIEICNVTERKTEHLVKIVEAVGEVIKMPIHESQIISVHRVPHNNEAASEGRPKNIVVKLATRVLRDNVVSAARRTRALTTEAIHVTGPARPIFVNEHLTLANKMLFREAKNNCKQAKFKYCWVKNGSIYVRKEDLSRVIVVRCADDLSKIV